MALTKEEQDALDLHNTARREAPGGNRPSLTWSTKLAAEAAAYAKKQAQKGIQIHDPQNQITKQGENLYFISHTQYTTPNEPRPTYIPTNKPLSYAVQQMIDEKKHYKGQKLRFDDPSGVEIQWTHYCMVVWPEATKVGMAKFVTPPGDKSYKVPGTFFVAKYDVRPLVDWSAWGGVRNEVLEIYANEKSSTDTGRHEKKVVTVRKDGTRVITTTVTQFVMDEAGEGRLKGEKRDGKLTWRGTR